MNTLTSLILQRIDHILTAELILNGESTVKVDLSINKRHGHMKCNDATFEDMYYGNDNVSLRDISDLTLVLEVSKEKWTLLIGNFRYFAWIEDIKRILRYDITPDYKWTISGCRVDPGKKNKVRQISFFVNRNDVIWFECEE